MLTEREKKCFESHEATLLDYGTIKVLGFNIASENSHASAGGGMNRSD